MVFVIILIIWLVLCCLAGSVAEKKGRNFAIVFLLSVILSPIIGFIIALVMGESEQHRIERIQNEERIRAEIRKNMEN